MHKLLKVRQPKRSFTWDWPRFFKEFYEFKPILRITKEVWVFPPIRWIKYNIDGASRGNLELSSYAFCLRNEDGDLIYAESDRLENVTNIVAEATVMLKASDHLGKTGYAQVISQMYSLL